jgi:DNA-binding SARP family transcriptional activator
MDDLTYQLLGPLEVRRNGQVLDVGHRRQQAVLAVFALNRGRIVERDTLIDALWGHTPPATAVNTIQTYVTRLRKTIEPGRGPRAAGEILVTHNSGYFLSAEPQDIDVYLFEKDIAQASIAQENGDMASSVKTLRTALDRWQGSALSGLPGPGMEAERERLHELRWVTFERCIEGELSLGRSGELVGELKAAIAARPLHERLWGYLMLALERSGRCADALAAYRQSRAEIRAELGVEPGPELRHIHQRILAAR